MKIKTAISMALTFALVVQASCDSTPQSRIIGNYTRPTEVDPNATLVVTKETMIMTIRPLTITVNYKIVSASGNTLTVEFTAPNTPPDTSGTSTVEILPDAIAIRGGDFAVTGTWKRK